MKTLRKSYRIPQETERQIRELAELHGLTMTAVILRAVEKLHLAELSKSK